MQNVTDHTKHSDASLVERLYVDGRDERALLAELTHRVLRPGGDSIDLSSFRDDALSSLSRSPGAMLGISEASADRVAGALDLCAGEVVYLVGHRNPDFDCAASMLLMQEMLQWRNAQPTLHVEDAAHPALILRAPDSVSKLEFRSLPPPGANGRVILLDAVDAHATNVRLHHSHFPFAVFDNHRGELRGEQGFDFPEHVALSTALMGVLAQTGSIECLRSEQFSRLAAWTILAIYTDTAELMRAETHEWEALRSLLPLADTGVLREFAENSLEGEAQRIAAQLQVYSLKTGPLSLIAARMPMLRTRDLGGFVADVVMRENPELSACLMVAPEVSDAKEVRARGFLRVRPDSPAPEILDLASATFSGGSFGARGESVAGGVVHAAKEVLSSSQLEAEMIRRFLTKGAFPHLEDLD